MTLADFALDALKKRTWLFHASVWRLAAFRKTVDFFARSEDLSRRSRPTRAALGFYLGRGLGCLGARDVWCSAYWIEAVFLCAFCIGLPQATRIARGEECVLYRESHDVTVFENVFFAFWSKFTSKE